MSIPEQHPDNRLQALRQAGQSVWLDFLRRGLITGGGLGWARLAAAGARVQCPLWASTGTKNPAYGDVVYLEELVGRDTATTVPEATLDAFRDYGRVRPDAVLERLEAADDALGRLAHHGVDLAHVTAQLLSDGLAAFDADLAKVVHTIELRLEQAGS